jgi:hypothetical protein
MLFLVGSDFRDGLMSRLMVKLGLLAMLLVSAMRVMLGSLRNICGTARVRRGKTMMLRRACSLGGSMV